MHEPAGSSCLRDHLEGCLPPFPLFFTNADASGDTTLGRRGLPFLPAFAGDNSATRNNCSRIDSKLNR